MKLKSSCTELGVLADPKQYTKMLDIEGCTNKVLEGYLRMMLIIREVEERIGELATEGKARCPCHLGIGQEAIATGVSAHLRNTDRIFGGHRSHAHYLALGGDIFALLAEVLGKADGCSKGMGGSMHLFGAAIGFLGSVPIVGATVPIAVGTALAAKMDKSDAIAVVYFGDGASEEGVLHESLNLAANYKLPVLFVCENNFFSSHLDIALRQPSDRISRFAEAHRILTRIVDGNDVVAIVKAAGELIERSRAGDGPSFLEAVTYRWRGHVGPNEDIDVGVRRKTKDLAAWKKRDPIKRLVDAMNAAGYLNGNRYQSMVDDVRHAIDEAENKAMQAPYPEKSALLDLVYTRD